MNWAKAWKSAAMNARRVKMISPEYKSQYRELVESAERERIQRERAAKAEALAERYKAALEYAHAHLESMDNYSLVSGARHVMSHALKDQELRISVTSINDRAMELAEALQGNVDAWGVEKTAKLIAESFTEALSQEVIKYQNEPEKRDLNTSYEGDEG